MKSPLETLPWIGPSIAKKLNTLNILEVRDLIGQDAQVLYDRSNCIVGTIQDRCLLYTFRCAVYVTSTPKQEQQPEKLKRRHRKY